MKFPIVKQPGSVVFIDDDINYLTVISNVFESKWHVKTCASASDFLKYMEGVKSSQHGIDSYHRGAIERYKRGGSVAMEAIRYWNAFPQRFAYPLVAVIDYHMADMNGIEAIKGIKGWNGKIILLTGVADELMVCRAFNDRLIDYYIPKQSALIMDVIETGVNSILERANYESESQWSVWEVAMPSEHRLTLQSPEVVKVLKEVIGNSSEYICIGEPFGIMLLSFDGHVKWLQLETASTLDEAANIAQELGSGMDEVLNVRSGLCLTDARLRSSLKMQSKPEFAPIEFSVQIDGVGDVLYGATFDIQASVGSLLKSCYSHWRESIVQSTTPWLKPGA